MDLWMDELSVIAMSRAKKQSARTARTLIDARKNTEYRTPKILRPKDIEGQKTKKEVLTDIVT